jgi:hypothetical protein
MSRSHCRGRLREPEDLPVRLVIRRQVFSPWAMADKIE